MKDYSFSNNYIVKQYQKLIVWLKFITVLKNWPVHYYWKLLSKPKFAVYRFYCGAKLKIRPTTADKIALKEVWVHNIYFPPIIQIGPSDTIIDIGAHIGTFTIKAALKVTNGKVYAYELAPDNFELLKENIALNGLSNVKAFNEAVTNYVGEAEVTLCADNPLSHSLLKDPVNGLKTSVKTTTLSQIILANKIDKIRYLKVDCEGAEHDVLYHTPVELLHKVEWIHVECEDIDKERNTETMLAFLKGSGFRLETCKGPYGGSLIFGRQEQ